MDINNTMPVGSAGLPADTPPATETSVDSGQSLGRTDNVTSEVPVGIPPTRYNTYPKPSFKASDVDDNIHADYFGVNTPKLSYNEIQQNVKASIEQERQDMIQQGYDPYKVDLVLNKYNYLASSKHIAQVTGGNQILGVTHDVLDFMDKATGNALKQAPGFLAGTAASIASAPFIGFSGVQAIAKQEQTVYSAPVLFLKAYVEGGNAGLASEIHKTAYQLGHPADGLFIGKVMSQLPAMATHMQRMLDPRLLMENAQEHPIDLFTTLLPLQDLKAGGSVVGKTIMDTLRGGVAKEERAPLESMIFDAVQHSTVHPSQAKLLDPTGRLAIIQDNKELLGTLGFQEAMSPNRIGLIGKAFTDRLDASNSALFRVGQTIRDQSRDVDINSTEITSMIEHVVDGMLPPEHPATRALASVAGDDGKSGNLYSSLMGQGGLGLPSQLIDLYRIAKGLTRPIASETKAYLDFAADLRAGMNRPLSDAEVSRMAQENNIVVPENQGQVVGPQNMSFQTWYDSLHKIAWSSDPSTKLLADVQAVRRGIGDILGQAVPEYKVFNGIYSNRQKTLDLLNLPNSQLKNDDVTRLALNMKGESIGKHGWDTDSEWQGLIEHLENNKPLAELRTSDPELADTYRGFDDTSNQASQFVRTIYGSHALWDRLGMFRKTEDVTPVIGAGLSGIHLRLLTHSNLIKNAKDKYSFNRIMEGKPEFGLGKVGSMITGAGEKVGDFASAAPEKLTRVVQAAKKAGSLGGVSGIRRISGEAQVLNPLEDHNE